MVLIGARTHGIEDMLHTCRLPILVFDPGDLTMLIGAERDGRMLGIGVAKGEGVDLILHAM